MQYGYQILVTNYRVHPGHFCHKLPFCKCLQGVAAMLSCEVTGAFVFGYRAYAVKSTEE